MDVDRISYKLELVKQAVRGLVYDDLEEGIEARQREAVYAIELELNDIARAVSALHGARTEGR